MHTSTVLQATDFQYWQVAGQMSNQVDFATCFPRYHERDHVGVVTAYLEDGVCYTSYALLALTTAFYDVLRARSETFFDYPYHFALLGADASGVVTRRGHLALDLPGMGAPWAGLDVWPDSQWIQTGGTAVDMLRTVFARHLNHVFWPEGLRSIPTPTSARLPAHARNLLHTRLKSVYYYNTSDPNTEIRVTPTVETMVQQKSLARLPQTLNVAVSPRLVRDMTTPGAEAFPYVERYRRVSVETFLA
jgi:hypothetical protein